MQIWWLPLLKNGMEFRGIGKLGSMCNKSNWSFLMKFTCLDRIEELLLKWLCQGWIWLLLNRIIKLEWLDSQLPLPMELTWLSGSMSILITFIISSPPVDLFLWASTFLGFRKKPTVLGWTRWINQLLLTLRNTQIIRALWFLWAVEGRRG